MDINNEKNIIERLKRIEALYESSTFQGEKEAAEYAMNKITEKLKKLKSQDPPIEYQFSLTDTWSRKLFVALLRRFGIRPYRYARQRSTTVMARISKSFVDKTLWPEFQKLNNELRNYLEEITEKVIRESINSDTSESDIINGTIEPPKE